MQACIERMEAKHIGAVLEIERASFLSPWTKSIYTREIGHKSSHCFVAIFDEVLVAYISSWSVLDECTINRIACRPAFRRRGYSTILLNYLINKVCSNNVKCLLVEVRESNTRARGFYKKSGFLKKGFRKNYYLDTKEDAILMSLDFENCLSGRNNC